MGWGCDKTDRSRVQACNHHCVSDEQVNWSFGWNSTPGFHFCKEILTLSFFSFFLSFLQSKTSNVKCPIAWLLFLRWSWLPDNIEPHFMPTKWYCLVQLRPFFLFAPTQGLCHSFQPHCVFVWSNYLCAVFMLVANIKDLLSGHTRCQYFSHVTVTSCRCVRQPVEGLSIGGWCRHPLSSSTYNTH